MKLTSSLCSTALACGLALGMYTTAAAQKPAHAPRGQHRAATSPSTPKPKDHDTFRGIAGKLNTTPDALESAYQTAKQANPNLKRGQFVAANMIAHNLSAKNPSITPQAILDGLKSGKSIGQTLQGLGLSAQDAREAQRQADRDAKEAEKQAT
jgi:hypothetical protein